MNYNNMMITYIPIGPRYMILAFKIKTFGNFLPNAH